MNPRVYQKATKKRPESLIFQASGRFQFLYVYQLATSRTFFEENVRLFSYSGRFSHFFAPVRGVIQAYWPENVPFCFNIGVNSPKSGPKS